MKSSTVYDLAPDAWIKDVSPIKRSIIIATFKRVVYEHNRFVADLQGFIRSILRLPEAKVLYNTILYQLCVYV